MLFFVALVIWFALSIPATVVIGRMLGGATRGGPVPSPETDVRTRTHALVRS